jgi:hypothetical protein
MIDEFDAHVARLYGLSEPQLVHLFETFHEGWDHEVGSPTAASAALHPILPPSSARRCYRRARAGAKRLGSNANIH